MKYKIGDKVQLRNGCTIEIVNIPNQTSDIPIYGVGSKYSPISVITEEEILRKI